MCPTGAIAPDSEGVPTLVDPEACTSCRLCEHICPDFAVIMGETRSADEKPEDDGATGRGSHPPNVPEVCHPFGACDG